MVFSNGVEVTKRVDDFSKRVQYICAFFRNEIVQVSLQTMGDTFGVSAQTLSAFEKGKSRNVEHLSYYYDMIQGDEYKKLFLRLIFDCDNKCIRVRVYKKPRFDVAKNFYEVVGVNIKEIDKTDEQEGFLALEVENVI